MGHQTYAWDETEDSLQSPVPVLNLDLDVSTESGGNAGTEMDADRNANTMRESQFMEMSEEEDGEMQDEMLLQKTMTRFAPVENKENTRASTPKSVCSHLLLEQV